MLNNQDGRLVFPLDQNDRLTTTISAVTINQIVKRSSAYQLSFDIYGFRYILSRMEYVGN